MKHFNDHLLCSFDLFTTGPDPTCHEILDLAFVPLQYDYTPDKSLMPLLFKLKPQIPELGKATKEQINEAIRYGIDRESAAEAMVGWFEKLQLGHNRKVMLLSFNTGQLISFLIAWLGEHTFEYIFYPYYRCLHAASLFVNDKAAWSHEPYPISKNNATYVLRKLNLERPDKLCVTNALYWAEGYKRLVQLP